MLSNTRDMLLAACASIFLASCGGGGELPPVTAGHRPAMPGGTVTDFPAMLGPSYDVGCKTYTPEDAANYDEVGYAGTYNLAGGTTANGEAFVPEGVSAAHKTLPLPSYVEVTSLDSGKTILVRINDRGPLTNGRIIDLSRGATEQLGISGGNASPVRVRRVNPQEQERAALRAHGHAAERLETPAPLIAVLRQRLGTAPSVVAVGYVQPSGQPPRKPSIAVPAKPNVKPAPEPTIGANFTPTPIEHSVPTAPPAPRQNGDFVVEQVGVTTRVPAPAPKAPRAVSSMRSGGAYVVQIAAFAQRVRAEALARMIGGSASQSGSVWRVRLGPYATQAAAKHGVRAAAGKGYPNALIMANDAP